MPGKIADGAWIVGILWQNDGLFFTEMMIHGMDKRSFLKLAMGTARFGLDYGIGAEQKKVDAAQVFELLARAAMEGLDVIDTAHEYGDSERIIGSFLTSHHTKPRIVSKLPPCGHGQVTAFLEASLKNLGVNALYGYLIHRFDSYQADPLVWDELCRLKAKGKVGKIGFSLYYPRELEKLLNEGVRFDLVQIPVSILDQRFLPYLERLKARGVEVHARSIFLQGLLLKRPEDVPLPLQGVVSRLSDLRKMSQQEGVPLEVFCLLFVALNACIDKVVVGMGSPRHFESNIRAFSFEGTVRRRYEHLLALREDDENVIVPSRWNLTV
ncbi:MAG: aldo/keto reductase [Candidatus Omnitrophota bacterium]